MFPLGSVVFPFGHLPLQVFEPRYIELVQQIADGRVPPEFGVVLIERGSEVGGGDIRFDVGTRVLVERLAALPDARFALETQGVDRVRVIDWLADAPFPRARVEVMAEPEGNDAVAARDMAEFALRRLLALAVELGVPVDVDVAIADDPVPASYEIATIAPLATLDAQEVLAIDDAADRLRRLEELLDDRRALFEAQAAADRADPDHD